MTRKIILFIFISIIYNNTSYGFMTKNDYTDLGEACENNFTYNKSSHGFDTGAGTTIKTIPLHNCQYKQNNCRIAYFETGNKICTFPFDHSESTLSVPKSTCSSIGDLFAYWAKSSGSNLYKININYGATAYFDCETGTYTTPTRIEKDCVAGYTFSHYSAILTHTNGSPCNTSSSTLYSNQTIKSTNYTLSGECPILLLTVQTKKCPKGHYCPEKNCFENIEPCPAGHTTAGTGAKSKDECIITDETEFCDRNGCFKIGDLK